MQRLAAVLTILLLCATTARAQAPHLPHRTLRTAHFAVHFAPGLEPLARRAAVHAERAYAALGRELVAPRGTIELVIADNVDYANGYATTFPTNRIVVYAHPPIESPALRYNEDWLELVVTHELAHVFHLDRSRGLWRGLQYVFGRNPLLFPNSYTPRWLTEGLATYYESRITGTGRVKGTYHRELALAGAREGGAPRLDQISVATPVFPGGEGVYVYGSLFLDYLARTRGAQVIPSLVERTAAFPIPFALGHVSRGATGTSFSNAWREFTDSLERGAGAYAPPLDGWRDLTPPVLAAEFLRWQRDGAITWTGAAPRELYGAYELAPDGTRRFLGRRNGPTPEVRLADGRRLYAQPDYIDPYTYRGDLYVERDGDARRLTRGARLSAPDASTDGRVIAVQAVPGGSRLVRIDLATRAITPITAGGMDEYWAEPRWSPDGTRIAAIHWLRGRSAVTIVDTDGTTREVVATAGVQSAPAWFPDGRALIFTSDAGGTSSLYVADLAEGSVRPLANTPGSLFSPAMSPEGQRVAAVGLGGGGFRVGTAPLGGSAPVPASSWSTPSAEPLDSTFTGPATPYSAFRQLLPRFWLPAGDGNADDTRIGFYTLGQDVLQRHTYEAQLAFPVEGHGVSGAFTYSYAGFARPVLSASVAQYYDLRGGIYADTTFRERIGHVDRRTRGVAVSATFARPRVRSALQVVLGAGADWRANVVHPDVPLGVEPGFFEDSIVPRVVAGLGYSRVRSAPYAISPEDGFTFSAAATNRWVDGGARTSQVVTSVLTGYRSLALPGFARHVGAMRLAGGFTDLRATDGLEVGGVSGAALPVAFGLASIGEGRRTFFVRGFAPGTLIGTRAWAASAEYRAPLALLARGAGLLPLFLDRTSLAVFGDAGSAWFPGETQRTIGAAGAEARLTLAFGSWDMPFQLRAGVARPVLERGLARDEVTAYLTTGLSF